MLRYQTSASMLRTAALALLFGLSAAGCASAQTPNFCLSDSNPSTTIHSLLGTTCSVGTTTSYVTYTWNAASDSTPGYVCTSDSNTTCPADTDINVSILDNGCSGDDGYTNYETYALLFVQNKAYPLSVNNNDPGGVGHWIDIKINGSFLISGNQGGTHHNFNWPHFNCLAGQAKFGVETNTTTVYCGQYCTGNGVSTIRCDANAPARACYDDRNASDYQDNYDAPFTGGDATTSYPFTIEINVTAPSGSASNSAFIYSLGTHIVP